jgi:hypothetical protein
MTARGELLLQAACMCACVCVYAFGTALKSSSRFRMPLPFVALVLIPSLHRRAATAALGREDIWPLWDDAEEKLVRPHM